MTESRTIRPRDEAEVAGIEVDADRDTVEGDTRQMSHHGDPGRGTWMQVYPAHKFYPGDVRLEDIHLESVVWSLPHLCRYGGHTRYFYSVAQHSILIARWLKANGFDDETCVKGLFHDGSEGYLVDMPRPIKPLIPEYYTIENKIQEPLYIKLGLTPGIPDIVKKADSLILYDEGMELFDDPIENWHEKWLPGLGLEIPGEEPFNNVRREFKELYRVLSGETL